MIIVAADMAGADMMRLTAPGTARAIAGYPVISAISFLRPRLKKCLSTALMIRATDPSIPMMRLWRPPLILGVLEELATTTPVREKLQPFWLKLRMQLQVNLPKRNLTYFSLYMLCM
jgi:hypothetical protein